MKPRTRSILQEISELASSKSTEAVIESRAENVIKSAINLIELIESTYDAETSGELTRRIVNSIKGRDSTKFTRGIRKIALERNTRGEK